MTEQQLDCAYVGSPFKEMDGKGMPERMRGDRFRDTADTAGFLACVFDRGGGDVIARDGTWKQPVPRFSLLPPIPHNLKQSSRKHDVPVFVALALFDANDHPPAIDVGGSQANGFRDTQPGRVAGGENRVVFSLLHGTKKP